MKILIVDDSSTNRRLLRQILVRFGYEPIEADSGPSAIDIIKEQDIDIILMDIMMPGMDGYETTKNIKQLLGDNHIPIIFVTALQGEEALGKALECGGDDYISKPVNLEILESKIRAHTRIRELTQQILANNMKLVTHNHRLQYEHELISYFFDNALERSYLDERCIRYQFSPMAAFNGDIMLSRRSPSGGLYLLLGDFTGHGLTAAMGTLPVAQIFFELTQNGLSVGDLAKKINATLKSLLPDELFLAACIVEINAHGNQLDLWNGGMPESVIAPEEGDYFRTIISQHMPLGILEKDEFDSSTVQHTLEKGDRLILYTDGIIETRNSQNEEFGEERLRALFTESGDQLFETIHKKLADFRSDKYQQDDMSIVEILCDQLPDMDNTTLNNASRKNKIPWHFSTTINSDILCNANPVSDIVDTLDTALSLGSHKGLIHTILSEAYNNSLNHSILGLENTNRTDDNDFLQYYEQRKIALADLQDAYIKCTIEFTPSDDSGELRFLLEDSGNHASENSNRTQSKNRMTEDPDSLHGRGLLILSELCDDIKIDNPNNRIELTYTLHSQF